MHTRLVSAVASGHPNAIQLTVCEFTGANDVANSWATSVSSKSVTMKQAIVGAAIFEFLGAVLVGGRVSSTIKNGIIPANVFQNDAGLQLLGFVNAIFISSRMYSQLLFFGVKVLMFWRTQFGSHWLHTCHGPCPPRTPSYRLSWVSEVSSDAIAQDRCDLC